MPVGEAVCKSKPRPGIAISMADVTEDGHALAQGDRFYSLDMLVERQGVEHSHHQVWDDCCFCSIKVSLKCLTEVGTWGREV